MHTDLLVTVLQRTANIHQDLWKTVLECAVYKDNVPASVCTGFNPQSQLITKR